MGAAEMGLTLKTTPNSSVGHEDNKQFDALFKALDHDNDKEISPGEFASWWDKTRKQLARAKPKSDKVKSKGSDEVMADLKEKAAREKAAFKEKQKQNPRRKER